MNHIFNKFLLNGDRFMPKLHLRQPGFTYSACGLLTKHRERTQKFIERGKRYILKRRGALYVGHHSWSTKKILGFRSFERAKITIKFWRNISSCIFRFSPIFIYNESLLMKSYKVFKIYEYLVRKKKKNSCSSQ